VLALALLPAGPVPRTTAEGEPPLTVDDFQRFVGGPTKPGDPFTQGFGDRDNSWAWSMQWWRGRLFVGTSRAYRCFSRASLARIAGFLFPYPPPDPDQDCTSDPADLDLQAEIWTWTPPAPGGDPRGKWERIFQSPRNVPVPNQPTKFVAADVGFRGMAVHKEKDGTESLYVAGVNTAALWGGTKVVPPPRILRISFPDNDPTKPPVVAPVPQDRGTFLGELTKGSFRSPTSYDGRLFILHGTIQGAGVLLASDDPSQGNDAWREVGPPGQEFFEMEPFNGWLYLGSRNPRGGYTVLKTKAQGDPYEFITVVPAGAFLQLWPSEGVKPSSTVVSMHVFDGRLYVGTDNPAELIRINPDDTWELVAGTPRRSPTGAWIYPLSGLDDGFAHQFNDHIWRQGSRDGFLYIGTYDASMNWKDDPQVGPRFRHLQGTDVYRTADGWYWTPITLNGFGDPFSPGPKDPNPDGKPVETGGRFNFGTRSFADTPYGLFLGTANDAYGLNIFRALPAPPGQRLAAPARAEVELFQQRPVLSWEPVPGAVRYRVIRAVMEQVRLRPFPVGNDTSNQNTPNPTLASLGVDVVASGVTDAEGDNVTEPADEGEPPEEVPGRLATWVHRPFQQIATVANTVFVDEPIEEGGRRLYMVVAEDAQGRTSEPSNLVLAPMLIPPATFTDLLTRLNYLQQRGMFTSPEAAAAARFIIQEASGAAVANRMDTASEFLQRLRQQVLYGAIVYYPEAKDLEVQISKLIRRMKLVHNGYLHQAVLFV
jgi:hypothetical protein